MAIANGQKVISRVPNAGFVHTWLALAYDSAGKASEAVAEAELASGSTALGARTAELEVESQSSREPLPASAVPQLRHSS